MKLTRILLILFLFLSSFYLSQVLITTTNYLQNFGTSTISSWTNNSTFLGWYVNDVTEFQGDINITATAPTNTGGVYVYRCSGGTDRKLGSRASGGTATIYYGLRIRNNTGSTIQSITVSYTAFQLSLAENNNNSNINTFSYRVVSSPTTITDLTTGVYTSVAALNYTAPMNHGGPGTSNQVNGVPCTTSSSLSSCIAVTIPNNGEIMLRWTDIDNSANDHHLAIDDVNILFHFDNACSITLPIELIGFIGYNVSEANRLEWTTASERDNDYFVLEKSIDGIDWEIVNKVDGYGTTSQMQSYYTYDYNPKKTTNYYRLKQVDFNGDERYFHIISIDNRVVEKEILKIIDLMGREVDSEFVGLKIYQYKDGTTLKTF